MRKAFQLQRHLLGWHVFSTWIFVDNSRGFRHSLFYLGIERKISLIQCDEKYDIIFIVRPVDRKRYWWHSILSFFPNLSWALGNGRRRKKLSWLNLPCSDESIIWPNKFGRNSFVTLGWDVNAISTLPEHHSTCHANFTVWIEKEEKKSVESQFYDIFFEL